MKIKAHSLIGKDKLTGNGPIQVYIGQQTNSYPINLYL